MRLRTSAAPVTGTPSRATSTSPWRNPARRAGEEPSTSCTSAPVAGPSPRSPSFRAAPSQPRTTRPSARSRSAITRAMFTGTAKPMPEPPPFWATKAVFTPITRPCASTSGPPELPGLMAASVWMKSS